MVNGIAGVIRNRAMLEVILTAESDIDTFFGAVIDKRIIGIYDTIKSENGVLLAIVNFAFVECNRGGRIKGEIAQL